jgi:AcrR family transcriptional regulator
MALAADRGRGSKPEPGRPPSFTRTKGTGRHSRRDEILQAATELFAKTGSKGSIATIAERIGVSPAAVIHHFKTKTALLIEVIAQTDLRDEQAMGLHEAASAVERLRKYTNWPKLLEEDTGLAQLQRLSTVMVTESLDPDHPSHEHMLARHREFRHLLATSILAGQEDGTIKPDLNPYVLATEIIAFMQGSQIQWFLDPEDTPFRQVFEAYFERLLGQIET